MLNINRCRQSFQFGFLVFTMLVLKSNGSQINNNQIDYKLKAIDMEYGERLTSLEQEINTRNGITRYTRDNQNTRMKMLCTTERPIPAMDPSYVPPSSCEDKTELPTHSSTAEYPTLSKEEEEKEEGEIETTTPLQPYLAPHPVGQKLFFIDDS